METIILAVYIFLNGVWQLHSRHNALKDAERVKREFGRHARIFIA